MRRKKNRLVGVVLIGLVLLAAPGIFRVYEIAGGSDAPSLFLNDRVLVNRAAYDCAVPYSYRSLFSWADPERGDMIIVRAPDGWNELVAVKRVVGIPSDTVELRDNVLIVNGSRHEYAIQDPDAFDRVPAENRLGSVVALERGLCGEHLVTYTPGKSSLASFGPLRLGDDEYFLLGDNRDASRDSRSYGPIRRETVIGKMLQVLPFRRSAGS